MGFDCDFFNSKKLKLYELFLSIGFSCILFYTFTKAISR